MHDRYPSVVRFPEGGCCHNKHLRHDMGFDARWREEAGEASGRLLVKMKARGSGRRHLRDGAEQADITALKEGQ